MQYIQVSDDQYIQYDEVSNTSSVVSLSVLQAVVDNAPVAPSDEDLLAWAKLNYPGLQVLPDQLAHIAAVQAQIDDITNSSIDIAAQVATNLGIKTQNQLAKP